jgi:hypothetical protein
MKKVLLVAMAIGAFSTVSFAQEGKKANNEIRIKQADPNRPKAVKSETTGATQELTLDAPTKEPKVKSQEMILAKLEVPDNTIAEINSGKFRSAID